MFVIAVDIGNSSTKVAIRELESDGRSGEVKLAETNWIHRETVPHDVEFHVDLSTVKNQPKFWSVCSVNSKRLKECHDWISRLPGENIFHEVGEADVPLETNVASRAQLGRDRLVAAWAAKTINRCGPVIIVDAGTAVTIDLVGKEGQFEGGFIFPGAEANFQILKRNTDALPDLSNRAPSSQENEEDESPGVRVGTDTDSAITAGVIQSQIAAIKGIVQQLSGGFSQPPAVFITGGGIFPVRNSLPTDWHHAPDLVLQGAFEIGKLLIQNSAKTL